MSKYDTPELICTAISTFIVEIREQMAAIRAYDNVWDSNECQNVFLQRTYESTWRELLSELTNVFDKSCTGLNENCTLVRLRELCLSDRYLELFSKGDGNDLIQSLDEVFRYFEQLPLRKIRNKQLSHHDMKQLFEGECIQISLEQIEKLVLDTTDVFAKIYTQFHHGWVEVTFADYNMLVRSFENALIQLIGR